MNEGHTNKMTKGIKLFAYLIPLLGYFFYEALDSGYLTALLYTGYVLFFISSFVSIYLFLAFCFESTRLDRLFYLLFCVLIFLATLLSIFGAYTILLRLSFLSLVLAAVIFFVYKVAVGRGE